MTEIRVPTLGKSVTEATIGRWFKKAGDAVKKDETLVELETDKVSVEVSAPEAGVLSEIVAAEGATVGIGAILGRMGGAGAQASTSPPPPPKAETPKPATTPPPPPRNRAQQRRSRRASGAVGGQRIAAESGIDVSGVSGSGKDGRVTKADVLAAIENARGAQQQQAHPPLAARGRRSARRARADDAPAPHDRAPSQGSAEHRRDADDVQ